MNSFNTHSDTLKIVRKYKDLDKIVIDQFNQSKYPRISQDSMLPLLHDASGTLEDWYPPGHGDLYGSFARSGLLDKYIEEGKEWLFVSNIDNLAATVDWRILKHAVRQSFSFT